MRQKQGRFTFERYLNNGETLGVANPNKDSTHLYRKPFEKEVS